MSQRIYWTLKGPSGGKVPHVLGMAQTRVSRHRIYSLSKEMRTKHRITFFFFFFLHTGNQAEKSQLFTQSLPKGKLKFIPHRKKQKGP